MNESEFPMTKINSLQFIRTKKKNQNITSIKESFFFFFNRYSSSKLNPQKTLSKNKIKKKKLTDKQREFLIVYVISNKRRR